MKEHIALEMSERQATEFAEGHLSALDQIAREGARRMLEIALKAEADAYVSQYADVVDENGNRLVVRNVERSVRL